MKRIAFTALTLATAATGLLLGGCSSAPTESSLAQQPLPDAVELAMASDLPTFGVGDELGWLAFGDLALAPMPGEPRDVLVIARAESSDAASFDWVGQYLALAD